MTIASEITRIKTNIENAYTALGEKGATLPEVQNSANLADTVGSVSTGGGQGNDDIPEGYYKTVFVDYDGTVLSEQLVVAGGSAVAPDVPAHQELTFTGWNREYTNVSEHQMIGACYSIPAGMSIYVVDLTSEQLEQSFYFTYRVADTTATRTGYINWGDGNTDTITEFEGDVAGWHSIAVNHTYTEAGRYYIKCYYWQTLAGSTMVQSAGGLTKSLPTDSTKAYLDTHFNPQEAYIIPEEFQELKELYVSPEFAYGLKDPFYAPNLEAVVFSSSKMHLLNSNETMNALVSFFSQRSSNVNRLRSLVANNKISHVTLPNSAWEADWVFAYMPNLKSISYMQTKSGIELYKCCAMTELFNMVGWDYGTAGIQTRLKLYHMPSLQKLYNPLEKGVDIQNSQKLSNLTLNYPVSLQKCNGLKSLDANFSSVSTPTLFRVDSCPSLETANINWAKVDLNVQYSKLPLFKSEYLTGTLDLSASTALYIGETITAASTSYAYDTIFNNLGYSKIILPPQLKTFNGGFRYMYALTNIKFPDSLEVISMQNLLVSCYLLESIDFPLSVSATSYSTYNLYQYCYNLKNAIIPSGTKLNSAAIQGCPSLKKVWVSKDADLSKYTSSSYTLFGTSSDNAAMSVTIYTDAPEKPSTWGAYWNYAGSSYGTNGYVDVVWNATETQYKNA